MSDRKTGNVKRKTKSATGMRLACYSSPPFYVLRFAFYHPPKPIRLILHAIPAVAHDD